MTTTRHIKTTGSPTECGKQIGEKLETAIRRLIAHKQEKPASVDVWNKQINLFEAAIRQHAPVCYAELTGIASSGVASWREVLSLACEYELWMQQSRSGDKCTGFVAANHDLSDPGLLMGQTNDEDPAAWLNAELDCVIHRHDEQGLSSLIYTHPGIPAYVGMNSAGLVVQWQYIDNGERDFTGGVPTTVLIREMLTKHTLEEAIDYLREVPRASPNCFQLGQPGRGAVNIECTPTRFIHTEIKAGCLCHANHITTDVQLQSEDIGITRTSSTSHLRLQAIEQYLPAQRMQLQVSEAEDILSTHPIFYERTLAAVICIPTQGEMRIRFAGDGGEFLRFSL